MATTLYMKVSKDNLELPIAVADTVEELAKIVGVNRTTVFRGLKKGNEYVKVDVSTDEITKSIRDEIVKTGLHYFNLALEEKKFNGESLEYNKLFGIAEGLRMATSIIFQKERG